MFTGESTSHISLGMLHTQRCSYVTSQVPSHCAWIVKPELESVTLLRYNPHPPKRETFTPIH